ncbi:MAG: exo-alpha-sialidase [Gemmatimonadetes bacterium]|jgi:sialidase-1|nr:exo-alpha-sialidase [Gemmatimonadota bacterium]MBT6148129.1 exo-alpha-sialidase [Gemmatimonadota bacterium]MBT7859019.1 exo-alpha-sialidase [Gemmatimonadota bacterium]
MRRVVHLENLDRQVVVQASEAEPRNMGADLMVLTDGRWLMGYSRWLGGAHDDDGSQICGMLSDDGGDTWSTPFAIALRPDGVEAVRMPCFLRLKDGRLACFYRVRETHLDTWTGMIICRDETRLSEPGAGPELWTDPVRISPPAPGRHVLLNNRALRLQQGPHAGRILLPLASPWPWDEEDRRGTHIRSWVLYSDDDGATWQPSQSMLEGPERGLMEPYLMEHPDGRVRMWMRTQMDCQYESISSDGGNSWSPATPGPLVSPESPVAVARHEASGMLMIVWNHNRRGKHTADRTPIGVAFSEDEGDSWFGEHTLDPHNGDRVVPAGDGEPANTGSVGAVQAGGESGHSVAANPGAGEPGEADDPGRVSQGDGRSSDSRSGDSRSFSYPGAHFLGDRGIVTYYENAGGRISLIVRRFDLRLD